MPVRAVAQVKTLREPSPRPTETRRGAKSGRATIHNFDPAKASVEQLAKHRVGDMFDLALRQRRDAQKRDEQFKVALQATLPAETKVNQLNASTILKTRIPVAIYARYSDRNQKRVSIEDQISECLRHCGLMGYEVILIAFDAAKTGQTLVDRSGWEKIENAARNGIISVVVAESLDRIARDPLDSLMILEKLRSYGVGLDTPSTGRASQLHVLMQSIYNTLFKSLLVEKVRRGMRGAVERGRHPGGTQYALQKKRGERAEDDTWVPYRPRAGIQFRIFWEVGVLKRHFQDILHDLNRKGIPAPRGGMWQLANLVTASGLSGLLCNPSCIGLIVWNKASYPRGRNGKRKAKLNGVSERVIGFNADRAFIPAWLWLLVQEEVAARKLAPAQPRGPRPRRLLTGILRCGVCGRGMHIIAGDLKNRPRVGCSTLKAGGKCANTRSFYLDTIEKMVARAIGKFLASPRTLEITLDSAVKEISSYKKQLREELKDLAKKREGLRPLTTALIRKMASAGIEGRQLREIVDRDLAPIHRELEAIDKRIAEVKAMLASDKLNPRKVRELGKVFGQLEKLLEDTGGAKLPIELIEAAQALIGKVELIPDKSSKHFELKIQGRLDAVASDDYISALAVINSKEYKNADLAAPLQNRSLITGKPFFVSLSSGREGIPVDREVGQRRLPHRSLAMQHAARRRHGTQSFAHSARL
jgi:site-specific DNA recombinase